MHTQITPWTKQEDHMAIIWKINAHYLPLLTEALSHIPADSTRVKNYAKELQYTAWTLLLASEGIWVYIHRTTLFPAKIQEQTK